MELSRRTIQRMILRQGSETTVINQSGGEGGGGGSQPSITLGPLLTSLNGEAMPSAEGYLHWTGSAWEWTTPTSGDPVDLTPYALKTWVQGNFATLNDISGLLTKSDADGYYAPISFVKPYLPLTAGSSYPLTGSLYITGNSGITWVGGYGMLCFKPTSGWSGVTENQWGVGSHSAQGVIRSSLELKRYDGTYQYTIWDTSNFDPLNYISKDGGTVAGTLNVRTQLNIQSAAGANKISIDGTTPNIDIASGGQITFDVDSHIAHDATNDRLVIHGNNGLLIDSDTYVGTVDGGNQVATRNFVGSQLELFDNYMQQWTSGQYLKLYGGGTLSGGNVTMVGNSLLFKRTAGGSYDGAIFASTVTPPGYQSAVGCITIGGPVNFDNDGAPPMVNGKYIATEQWVLNKGYITETNADDRYVSKNGGTVNGNLNVKGTIQAQDSSGNNKVIIYGTTGNIRAEKVYIGGSTSGYEAATHNWVTSQGYQANVIETVKVAGTALTPTNKALDIPAATSDGVTFGVVAIGTGFTFDEDRLCVAEAPITMGFKRLNKSTSETWDANTMTVNGTQYALLTNYRATSEWANMPSGMSWGGVLQITAGSGVGYLSGQLAWDSNHNVTTGVTRKLYWRSRNSTGWGTDDWHTIAFEDWVTGQIGNYLPLSAGTDKKLTGNLFFSTTGRGIYLKNPTVSGQTDSWFPAIYQNSSNLWIGAIASSATHHIGQTYISAGYDVASSKGNPTIYVSVPNASNSSALNYGVWHMGNLPTADVNAFIKGVSVSNIPLSPVDRVVNIPMAETNVPGVIQLGTGLVENESHTEVDTTVIASRTWVGDTFLPLTGAATKSGNLTISGALYVNGNGGTSADIINGIVSASAFNFKGSNAQLTTVKESATPGASLSEVVQYLADTNGRHVFRVRGSGSNELASIHAASIVFGNYTSDAAIYVEGGHVKARNASGTIITIV